jgi:hypothetical protein
MQAALKITLWLTAIIVLLTGAGILINGTAGVPGIEAAVPSPAVDSELRFLAVFWLAYGGFVTWVSLNLAERRRFLPAIALTPAVAAAARVGSYLATGRPTNQTLIAAIVVEFVFAGLIYFFYHRDRANRTTQRQKE